MPVRFDIAELGAELTAATRDARELLDEYVESVWRRGTGTSRDPVRIFAELSDAVVDADAAARELAAAIEREAIR
jgi:hypothetical protein